MPAWQEFPRSVFAQQPSCRRDSNQVVTTCGEQDHFWPSVSPYTFRCSTHTPPCLAVPVQLEAVSRFRTSSRIATQNSSPLSSFGTQSVKYDPLRVFVSVGRYITCAVRTLDRGAFREKDLITGLRCARTRRTSANCSDAGSAGKKLGK